MRDRQPTSAIASLLHSFGQDERERRQYRRVELRFALWWLRDFKGNDPVAGVGIEISGGGLQFLLKERIEAQCSLAFEINGRRMRANILVMGSEPVDYNGESWSKYRAKFVGLMQTDFDYLLALTGNTREEAAPPPSTRGRNTFGKQKKSLGPVESYDMLPLKTQDLIVAKLVAMKRLTPPQETTLAHLSAHYGGVQTGDREAPFHRFFIRSRLHTRGGTVVYDTDVLVSDDGEEIVVRQ